MSNEIQSFRLYKDQYPMVKRLNDWQAGRLYKMIYSYVVESLLPDEADFLDDSEQDDAMLRLAWDLTLPKLDAGIERDTKYHADQVEKGRKGGLASGKNKQGSAQLSTGKQGSAHTDTDTDTDTGTGTGTGTRTGTETDTGDSAALSGSASDERSAIASGLTKTEIDHVRGWSFAANDENIADLAAIARREEIELSDDDIRLFAHILERDSHKVVSIMDAMSEFSELSPHERKRRAHEEF